MRGLCETLAESYIAGVAIVVLLLWTIVWGLQGLWIPLYRFIGSCLPRSTYSILFPAMSRIPRGAVHVIFDLFNALVALGGAWLFQLVYGRAAARSARMPCGFVARNRAYRLKRALVESFVGAIALGDLMAQGIVRLREFLPRRSCLISRTSSRASRRPARLRLFRRSNLRRPI